MTDHSRCRVPGCTSPLLGLRFCGPHGAAWRASPEGKRAYAFNVHSSFSAGLLTQFLTRLGGAHV